MVNSVQDVVAPYKSEKRAMEESICHESPSKSVESNTTLSEPPQKEADEIQNGEKVNEDQKNETSASANGLAIAVSSTPEIVQDQYSGQNLNTGNYLVQCGKQIRTPSKHTDKGLEDGYNWRKYGQKLVKGNEFVRSYYRCTNPSCRAKRQVERSQDGRITDTVYIGKHEHDKPQPGSQVSVFSLSPIQLIEPEVTPLATEEDKTFDSHGQAPTSHETKSMASHETKSMGSSPAASTTSVKNVLDGSNSQPVQPKLMKDEINNDGDPPLKRWKRDVCDVDENQMEKPHGEPRFVGEPRVVQTRSEVDVLQDGYRWRKYGQKLVKGNPNPRSYYRCSNSGCLAKKHVERASYDAKLVITTYEGQHDHDMPSARSVTHNKGGAIASTTALEDETRPKPEEIPTVGLDMVV